MRSATSLVALFALHLAACGDIVLPSTGGTDLGGTSGQPDSGGSDGGSGSGVDDLGGGTDGADEDVEAPGPGSDTEAPAADVDSPADAQDPVDVPADDDTGPTVSGPGAPCSADAQCASGYCVDGVCCYTACDSPCVACTTALSGLPEGSCGPVQANTDPKGTCPDDGAPSCGRTGVCDGKGACSLYPATTECSAPTCADGERTLAGTCDGQGACAPGDTTSCAPYACAGNACAGECASDASCVGATWCNGSTGECVPKRALGEACQTGKDAQCESGYCVDGVCCEAACDGVCSACSAALTGAKDGECRPASGGTDPDSECPDLGAAGCGTDGMCDGAGACRLALAGTVCVVASCAAGLQTTAATCDGAGTCQPGSASGCAPYACAGDACATTCTSDAQCADGAYCDGGTCVGAKAVGAACQSNASCATGACVDGFCCDTACADACFACRASLTNAADGECAPVRSGADPDGDCVDEGATTCGTNGVCDGAGGCARYDEATVCGPGTCADGLATPPRTCDGGGSCEVAAALACAPYVCGATGCRSACDVDADCVAGHYCNAGVCAPRLDPGGACSGANQCASGYCVDGVCCDTACTGACVACAAAGKGAGVDGVCGPVVAGQDPDAECVDDGPQSCGRDGSCEGAGACRRWSAGTVCAAAQCSAGSATEDGACDGAGTCVAGLTTICAPYRCGATACNTACTTDAECAPGNRCQAGECVARLPLGQACTADAECGSGVCADGVCCDGPCGGLCHACSAARKGGGANGVCGPIGGGLDPDDECAATPLAGCGPTGFCDGAGACALHANGAVCGAPTCGAGVQSVADTCDGLGVCVEGASSACGAYACGASACNTSCIQKADCAPGHYCAPGAQCLPEKGPGEACSVGAQCASGFCVDGVCCDSACSGLCAACTKARRGDTLPDGVCGPIGGGTDPDNECADQGAASCGTDGVCNGASACRRYAAGTVCLAAKCVSGSQTTASTCNGAGSCVPGTSSTCSPYTCGGAACLTSCAVDAECASGFCSGGKCSGKVGNGGACLGSNECASGFCVDGVCCNAACTGSCQACSAARKGQGADGACGAIVAGQDPDSECAQSSATTCGLDGTCDGAGACRRYVAGTVCGAASCASDTEAPASTCNGSGTCTPGTPRACSPYVCGASACKTSCASSADCASTHYCSAGTCVAKAANGAACATASACASGSCVDGVCCNAACTGLCVACTAARKGGGSDGVCGAVGAGTDPDNECVAQAASTCGTNGFCDGSGGCQRHPTGTICVAGSCASGVQTADGTCTSTGTCGGGATISCSPYVCGTTACKTSCASAADCVSTAWCSGGKCVAKSADGAPCGLAAECTSGFCVDGVCCDSSCGASCVACSSAKTGGTTGKCLAITSGTDPDNECTAQAASTCGTTGMCGTGGCAKWGSTTVCKDAACASGSQTTAAYCNGAGTCGTGVTSACTPYVCGATACKTSCALDSDCAGGTYCSSGACVAKKSNGAACAASNQCSSSFCVDGVCCSAACTGACMACTASRTGSTDGTCAAVLGGTDPDNECTDQGASTCGADGTCSGSGACRLYISGTVCIAATCASGSQTTAGVCNGTGTCKPGTTSACSPYQCGTSACVTTCSTAADCAAGNYCSGGKCVPQLAQGVACSSSASCATGYCVDGVCCESACTGKCQRCDSTWTYLEDGLCAAIDSGDPDSECTGTSLCCFGLCRTPLQCLQ